MKIRYLLLAILFEAFALAACFPAFVEGMMRHSARAPHTQTENISNTVGFALHLPTILLTYPFGDLILLTPITQIVFWFLVFTLFWRKFKSS